MKPSLVKPHCIEHVGDLYFQCPVQLNHICLRDQEQTTLKGEKGTGEDGIGPSLLTGHPQWCWLCTALTACVLTEYGTGCVQYWVPEIMAARGTECMWIKCVQKACGLWTPQHILLDIFIGGDPVPFLGKSGIWKYPTLTQNLASWRVVYLHSCSSQNTIQWYKKITSLGTVQLH